MRRLSTTISLLLALPLLGCSSGSSTSNPTGEEVQAAENAISPDAFDTERAWQDLERIVGFGPRPANSPALERLRTYLEAELAKAGIATSRESFTDKTPIGEIPFTNLIAELPGSSETTIVLGSHMDTKRLPFHFVGANDGGSSTALLLELARVLSAAETRPVSYRFVWFDGEESIRPDWTDDDSLYGSRHHVSELRRTGEISKTKALILFDLVADADLSFERDTNSDPSLLRLFVDTARSMGRPDLFSDYQREILDDHLPFMAAGIPSLDLIDLTYGRYNSYWHKAEDTLENCSAEGLKTTAALFLAAQPALEALALQP